MNPEGEQQVEEERERERKAGSGGNEVAVDLTVTITVIGDKTQKRHQRKEIEKRREYVYRSNRIF